MSIPCPLNGWENERVRVVERCSWVIWFLSGMSMPKWAAAGVACNRTPASDIIQNAWMAAVNRLRGAKLFALFSG